MYFLKLVGPLRKTCIYCQVYGKRLYIEKNALKAISEKFLDFRHLKFRPLGLSSFLNSSFTPTA